MTELPVQEPLDVVVEGLRVRSRSRDWRRGRSAVRVARARVVVAALIPEHTRSEQEEAGPAVEVCSPVKLLASRAQRVGGLRACGRALRAGPVEDTLPD